MPLSAPNVNHFWAGLIVEELVRCGVRRFCIAPGSRSTPLAVAVAQHPQAEAVVHFDERGTAFFALGYARACGFPAVWITTSGTAVANGLPAVIEADAEHVPMLLLTADRPPELRETGANQTIRQPFLFSDFVRWRFDLPAPDADRDPRFVLTTVDQAVARATGPNAGPVHLNLMFREPLAPTTDGFDPERHRDSLRPWLDRTTPFTTYATTRSAAAAEALHAELQGIENGLLVAGRLDSDEERKAVVQLAEALGWPLLPDVTSGLRLGGASGTIVHYYDLLLSDEAFREAHIPEAVLHVGGRFVSKALLQFLDQTRPRLYAAIRPTPQRLDPNHQASHIVQSAIAPFCETLAARLAQPTLPSRWLRTWRAASGRAGETLEAFFDQQKTLSEPQVARLVAQHLPADHALFVASSMPIRDLDRFAGTGGAAAPVAANRGASGIDGTIAAAAGFATGLGRPTTLLIGDLALLHDLNALALLRTLPVPLTLVCLNNDGGGIFSFLPIARHESVFEPLFGTPHGLTFEAAATLFGLNYARIETADDFVAAYGAACADARSTLLEIRTERTANKALHDAAREAVVTELR